MPVAYFDSSAVLSFLLQQPEGADTSKLWIDHESRVSSILLKAECLVNLRRNAARLTRGAAKDWLAERTAGFTQCMGEVTLVDVDESILSVIDREDGLSDCRTLDAIHAATAIAIRERAGEDFIIVSLDDRMRQVARKLKIKVLPPDP